MIMDYKKFIKGYFTALIQFCISINLVWILRIWLNDYKYRNSNLAFELLVFQFLFLVFLFYVLINIKGIIYTMLEKLKLQKEKWDLYEKGEKKVCAYIIAILQFILSINLVWGFRISINDYKMGIYGKYFFLLKFLFSVLIFYIILLQKLLPCRD